MILHVRVVEAKDLPKMDVIGKADPYVIIQMSGTKYSSKTKTVYDTYNPYWNEEFHFQVTNINTNHIDFLLKDEDRFTRDDPISKLRISLSHLQINRVVDNWYSPTPVKHVKKGGRLHLVLHLAEAGVQAFVDRAPPLGLAASTIGMAANNFRMFGQNITQMATNPNYCNPMMGAIPHPSMGPQPVPMFPQPQPFPMYQQPQIPMYQQPQPVPMYPQPQPVPMYQQPQPVPMYQQPQPVPMYQQPQQVPMYQPPNPQPSPGYPQQQINEGYKPLFPPPGM